LNPQEVEMSPDIPRNNNFQLSLAEAVWAETVAIRVENLFSAQPYFFSLMAAVLLPLLQLPG